MNVKEVKARKSSPAFRYCPLLLYCIVILTAFSGCGGTQEPVATWEEAIVVQSPPPTTEDYFPLLHVMRANPVDLIMVRTFNQYLEPEYSPLFFTQHGLLNGHHHVLVPLTEQSGSVFNMLGMTVSIDTTGIDAVLTRGRTTLTFTEGMLSMFVNREVPVYLPDMPLKYRGTLFVPFEPILDAFNIPWEIEYNVLIIGG